jgi:hypothetical protein
MLTKLTTFAASTRLHAYSTRLVLRAADDRGDVPGWVLVTVMTAGLVTAMWLIADDQLTGVLDRALTSIATP